MLLAVAFAAAAPDDDVARAEVARRVLDDGLDAFTGLAPESDGRAAWQLGDCATGSAWVRELLAAACARTAAPRWEVRPTLVLDAGDATPDNASGDSFDGMVGIRAGARAVLYAGPMVLRAAPSVGLDAGPGLAPVARLDELWVGYDRGSGWLGLGHQDRWMGAGQNGTLLLSDNAEAPWMLNGGVDGHLPGVLTRAGRFRAEVGVGLLTEPRTDVTLPGLLMMDFRWSPYPVVELGLNRLSIFAGEGRPAPDLGQLLIPSEPHRSDDPDKLLPDQDELATIVLKVNLPLHKWLGAPFGHLSGWWEYGGEDLIVPETDGFDFPQLAGVGNQYGGELALGPVVVTGEYTRLMDDLFRWYVGHRVYHEGFTQNGRVLGHHGGPDSETYAGKVSVWGDAWRARAWGDHVRRVGVVDVRADSVVALPTEEEQWRGGLGADVLVERWWLSGGYVLTSVEGANFTAGNDRLRHQVSVAVSVGGLRAD
ncbi:MAG: hypothetical protein EXR71_16820 [Myxococcales bacterium]|nr:hypothetical protein [Myxococcales bacterium]